MNDVYDAILCRFYLRTMMRMIMIAVRTEKLVEMERIMKTAVMLESPKK